MPKSEDKYVEKVFNWSEVQFSEMTCYKIHTLRNDVENNTASTNTEEIHLSPKTEENILSYCPC